MRNRIIALTILLASLCAISHSAATIEFLGDSSSNLKDALSGLASDIPASSSINIDNIFNCGFSPLSDALVASIQDLISEASGCNPTKISDISAKIKALITSLPADVQSCIATNSDAKTLFDGYNLTGKTPDDIEAAVTSWVSSNPLTACWDMQGLESDISNGNWKGLGADGGSLLLKVFSSEASFTTELFEKLGAHKDDFAQILTGLVSSTKEQVDVTKITACGDESTFASLETGLLQIIDSISTCNPSSFENVGSQIAALMADVPDYTKQCISVSGSVMTVLFGLGMLGKSPQYIEDQIVGYVFDNLLTICPTLSDLNRNLKNADFAGFGSGIGKILLSIFRPSTVRVEVI